MLPVAVHGTHIERLGAIGPARVFCRDFVFFVLRGANQHRNPHGDQSPQIGLCRGRRGPLVGLIDLAAGVKVISVLGNHLQHILRHRHGSSLCVFQSVVAQEPVVLELPDRQHRLGPKAVDPTLTQTGEATIQHVVVRAVVRGRRCNACIEVRIARGSVLNVWIDLRQPGGQGHHIANAFGHFHHQAIGGDGVLGADHQITGLEASVGFLHLEFAALTSCEARADKHVGRRTGQHPYLLAVFDFHWLKGKLELGRTARGVRCLDLATQKSRVEACKSKARRTDLALNGKQSQGTRALRLTDSRHGATPALGHGEQLVDRKQGQQPDHQPHHELDDGKALGTCKRRTS